VKAVLDFLVQCRGVQPWVFPGAEAVYNRFNHYTGITIILRLKPEWFLYEEHGPVQRQIIESIALTAVMCL
jgi:hypothetical protein